MVMFEIDQPCSSCLFFRNIFPGFRTGYESNILPISFSSAKIHSSCPKRMRLELFAPSFPEAKHTAFGMGTPNLASTSYKYNCRIDLGLQLQNKLPLEAIRTSETHQIHHHHHHHDVVVSGCSPNENETCLIFTTCNICPTCFGLNMALNP